MPFGAERGWGGEIRKLETRKSRYSNYHHMRARLVELSSLACLGVHTVSEVITWNVTIQYPLEILIFLDIFLTSVDLLFVLLHKHSRN